MSRKIWNKKRKKLREYLKTLFKMAASWGVIEFILANIQAIDSLADAFVTWLLIMLTVFSIIMWKGTEDHEAAR